MIWLFIPFREPVLVAVFLGLVGGSSGCGLVVG
jgi:hypothetical protein